MWAFPSSYISQGFQFDDSFEREWIFGWLMVFECQNYREGKHGNFLVHMKTRPLLAYFFFFFSMYCWFIPCSASRFILVSASLALFRKIIHLNIFRNQRKKNSKMEIINQAMNYISYYELWWSIKHIKCGADFLFLCNLWLKP